MAKIITNTPAELIRTKDGHDLMGPQRPLVVELASGTLGKLIEYRLDPRVGHLIVFEPIAGEHCGAHLLVPEVSVQGAPQ